MLIVIINLIHFTDNYAVLFLVYAIMMTVVIFIFALMSIFYYEYANYTEKEDDDGGDQEPLGNPYLILETTHSNSFFRYRGQFVRTEYRIYSGHEQEVL